MKTLKLAHLLNEKQKAIIQERQEKYGSYANFLALFQKYQNQVDICPIKPFEKDLMMCIFFTENMLAMKLARLVLEKDESLNTDSFDDIINYLVLTHDFFDDFFIFLGEEHLSMDKEIQKETLTTFIKDFIKKEISLQAKRI